MGRYLLRTALQWLLAVEGQMPKRLRSLLELVLSLSLIVGSPTIIHRLAIPHGCNQRCAVQPDAGPLEGLLLFLAGRRFLRSVEL